MIKYLILHKWYSKTSPAKAMVGVPESDVNDWLGANDDVEIRCEWEVMTIPAKDLKERILFKHTITLKSGAKSTLVNFAWEKDGADAEKRKQKRKGRGRRNPSDRG